MGRVLVGPRVELRPLERSFFDAYLNAFSECVRTYIGVDTESERLYLEAHYRQQKRGETHFFTIFCRHKNELMGAIEVRSARYRGQLYYWLNEKFWSQGFLQEALKLVASYYQAHTKKKEINAFIDVSNRASIKALQKFGFKKKRIHKGSREDQIEMIYFL